MILVKSGGFGKRVMAEDISTKFTAQVKVYT